MATPFAAFVVVVFFLEERLRVIAAPLVLGKVAATLPS